MKTFTYPDDFPQHIREPFERYVRETYHGGNDGLWSNLIVTRWNYHPDESAAYGMGYEIFWAMEWNENKSHSYAGTFLEQFGILDVYWQACGLECPVMTGGKCKKDSGKWCKGPKFDSAAAEILHDWSLTPGGREESGNSDYGNGWHMLFRDDRAILHTDSQGFVSAWRVPESEDIDTVWEEIESGAVYPDDWEERTSTWWAE